MSNYVDVTDGLWVIGFGNETWLDPDRVRAKIQMQQEEIARLKAHAEAMEAAWMKLRSAKSFVGAMEGQEEMDAAIAAYRRDFPKEPK